jgi:hypothetical protein
LVLAKHKRQAPPESDEAPALAAGASDGKERPGLMKRLKSLVIGGPPGGPDFAPASRKDPPTKASSAKADAPQRTGLVAFYEDHYAPLQNAVMRRGLPIGLVGLVLQYSWHFRVMLATRLRSEASMSRRIYVPHTETVLDHCRGLLVLPRSSSSSGGKPVHLLLGNDKLKAIWHAGPSDQIELRVEVATHRAAGPSADRYDDMVHPSWRTAQTPHLLGGRPLFPELDEDEPTWLTICGAVIDQSNQEGSLMVQCAKRSAPGSRVVRFHFPMSTIPDLQWDEVDPASAPRASRPDAADASAGDEQAGHEDEGDVEIVFRPAPDPLEPQRLMEPIVPASSLWLERPAGELRDSIIACSLVLPFP